MAEQKQDDQLAPTYSSSVRIRDVALRTYQNWWTIGRSGERGSGISVLSARHYDDDVYHHVTPSVLISLTLSCHPSLSYLASGRSSSHITYRQRAVLCRFKLVVLPLLVYIYIYIYITLLFNTNIFKPRINGKVEQPRERCGALLYT